MEDITLVKRQKTSSFKDSQTTQGRWEDLPSDIMQKVLLDSDFDDTSGLTSLKTQLLCGDVCTAWRSMLIHPQFWTTTDLSALVSDAIYVQVPPYVYVSKKSESILSGYLKCSLSFSKGCITTLIFNTNSYLTNDLFTYTAERTPNLKRLVMPEWNKIRRDGISKAIACWKDLESLTIEYIGDSEFSYLIQEISNKCKNFRELKLMVANSESQIALLIAARPKLKVLSLQCSKILQEHLIAILDHLRDLKVLNISHCLIMETPPALPGPDRLPERRILTEIDPLILAKASRLNKFITCMKYDSCIMCQRARRDDGLMKWYRYEPRLWKQDEVKSLAL